MLINEELLLESENRADFLGIDVAPSEVAHSMSSSEAGTRALLRGDRLTEAVRAARAPISRRATTVDLIEKRRDHLSFAGAQPSDKELERMLNGNDLVDEFYLERALVAAKAVCRLAILTTEGRGWATGFMVSPELLLTNWHVFNEAKDAINSIAEFDYTLDIRGDPVKPCRFALQPDQFFISDKELDYALVAVKPYSLDNSTALQTFGYHRLIAEPNKIMEGEWVTIIQHPGGQPRQYAIRDNLVIRKPALDQFMWYQSDTAQGSSGAPAFNDSFQVVALHHLGRARKENGQYILRDGRRVDSLKGVDDSLIDWIANEGLRTSTLCSALKDRLESQNPYARQLFAAMSGEGDIMSNALGNRNFIITSPRGESSEKPHGERGESAPAPAATTVPAGLVIPLQLRISLGYGNESQAIQSPATTPAPRPQPKTAETETEEAIELEKLVQPFIDTEYSKRRGYQEDFLGATVPLPKVTKKALVSKMDNGKHVIPYEHFSIVVHKQRRMALFTASNIDGTKKARQPEPGDYTRRGLTGLGKNDQEKWKTDPRIPGLHQLPDKFYNKDGKAFDKGHIIRREDVCWGKTYNQIKRANGDTYHTTNCSPQVAGFNRSPGIWGALEKSILGQAKKGEKYSIFAGPVLADDDGWFEGFDDWGAIRIQIPQKYWKIVVVEADSGLQSYAFVLEQNLKAVPIEEEFFVEEEWEEFLLSVQQLEETLDGISFPKEIKDADQSGTADGEELLKLAEIKRLP